MVLGYHYHMPSNIVITGSSIVRYCFLNCRNWSRISIICRIHKRHPYLALTASYGRSFAIIFERVDRVTGLSVDAVLLSCSNAYSESREKLMCVRHNDICVRLVLKCDTRASVNVISQQMRLINTRVPLIPKCNFLLLPLGWRSARVCACSQWSQYMF